MVILALQVNLHNRAKFKFLINMKLELGVRGSPL
jgi:hypothetical protein